MRRLVPHSPHRKVTANVAPFQIDNGALLDAAEEENALPPGKVLGQTLNRALHRALVSPFYPDLTSWPSRLWNEIGERLRVAAARVLCRVLFRQRGRGR